MKTLASVKIGEIAKVKQIHGSSMLKRRIMDMGITKNVDVEVIKFAPLGDPIELKLRGYLLSIRKEEAEQVEIF
ncbi:MAG: FeoA family protein [Tissierellia bacterium]|nr:FeoA family protein [Tissierellia bacterium]